MNNKKLLQILFFVFLAIGFGLYLFPATKPFGRLVLCFIQPIIALYYISIFNKEKEQYTDVLVLQYPLLLMMQITFVCISILSLFSIMHWPFFGPIFVQTVAVSVIALILSILYLILNRKVLQTTFLFEVIVLALPILIFMGGYQPDTVNKKEYVTELNEQYISLNKIEYSLYKKAKKDSLVDLSIVNKIASIKLNIIDQHGGMNEDGYIKGSLDRVDQMRWSEDIALLKTDSMPYKLKLKLITSGMLIEHLNALTELQIEILLKEKK
ncbi:hypothetical protein [Cytophaga aurantiaca]|uniref:hypothetical protein n=1 Tax=Cytophaga aurantiaca TaxID=29530 RepID=UPI00036EB785|nr:hypothetical protein [Cytophaga aurantiaca]